MDLYDEKEHVISSDEYSDDDDDDDDLMNDAIRAQDHFHARSSDFNHQSKQSRFKVDAKQKELSSLIRKNKISIIYKNKSIRWLNSKKQRERYKELIYQNKRKHSVLLEENENTKKKNIKIEIDSIPVQNLISIADSDNESITNNRREPSETSAITKANLEKKTIVELQNIGTKDKTEKLEERSYGFKKKKLIPEKRNRSLTPEILSEDSELKLKQNEKRSRIETPQFYKSINDMFPKFDNIATDHIDAITNNTLTSVEEKMKSLVSEINTLSEILNKKEMEWNRLLHLKTVKEEIYARLRQKRHNLQIKENYSKMESHRNLEDLKELELYLSEKKPVSPDVSVSTITIQKLIEKRANMNTEDLKREKNNTSRLHSLLVSSNMLHGRDSLESVSSVNNGERTNSFTTSKRNDLVKQLEEETFVTNRRRQGEFRDVKSIIADFKQKNPEMLPRVEKRNNLINYNLHHNISIPIHDKHFTSPQLLHILRQSDSCPRRNSVEEISTSPIGSIKKLPSNHDNDSVKTIDNHFNTESEDNYFKNLGKADFDVKLTKSMQYPLCQECKINESRFVCAGCGNQWYCSKKCQVSAWDKHSELCTE